MDSSSGLVEGSLAGLSLELKQSLSRVLRGFNREEVAGQVTKITGKKLSKAMLDKIVSSNPDYEPDIMQVWAICKITGNLEPFSVCLKVSGADIISNEEGQGLEQLKRDLNVRQDSDVNSVNL